MESVEFLPIGPREAVIIVAVTVVCFVIPVFIIFPPIPVEHGDALGQTHSRVGIPASESRVGEAKRHPATTTTTTTTATANTTPTVRSLFVYPVKSCQGIEVTRSTVTPSGLEHDRLYTFARLRRDPGDERDGQEKPWEFITIRQFPLLATVQVDLWVPDPAKKSRQLGTQTESFLVVRFPWQDPGLRGLAQWVAAKLGRGIRSVPRKEFLLPVSFPTDAEIASAGYSIDRVRIWSDTVSALNFEKDLAPELARYLGVAHHYRLGLFCMDPGKQGREVHRNAPSLDAAGYRPVMQFQDDLPVNIMNISSVQNLEAMLPEDETLRHLDVRRFRSNIIITGPSAFEEETWKSIALRPRHGAAAGGGEFFVACRTTRCKLPNVDPVTGERHRSQPDDILRKFRNVDKGAPMMGCLGMQMCPKFADAAGGEASMRFDIEVGMGIDVLETGEHVFVRSSS